MINVQILQIHIYIHDRYKEHIFIVSTFRLNMLQPSVRTGTNDLDVTKSVPCYGAKQAANDNYQAMVISVHLNLNVTVDKMVKNGTRLMFNQIVEYTDILLEHR